MKKLLIPLLLLLALCAAGCGKSEPAVAQLEVTPRKVRLPYPELHTVRLDWQPSAALEGCPDSSPCARFRPRPLGTTTPPAPAASAAAAKSAPSNRSPRIATYSSPAPSVRVSIDTPVRSPAGSPDTTWPPIASATHPARRRISLTNQRSW